MIQNFSMIFYHFHFNMSAKGSKTVRTSHYVMASLFYMCVFVICIMVIWIKLFIIYKILDFSKKFPDQNDLTIQFIPFKVVFSPIQSLDRHEYSFFNQDYKFFAQVESFSCSKKRLISERICQNDFRDSTFCVFA